MRGLLKGLGLPLAKGHGDGEGRWHQRQFGATDLARSWAAAASGPPVQAVERSAVRGQAPRDRRPLRQSARRAIVLSVDEKSQIQALDRTQPGLR
jgi:hypothetical protein